MNRTVKGALRYAGVHRPAGDFWNWFEPRKTYAVRAFTGKNRRLAASYLANSTQPMLHIGCGDNELPGWLNTDLNPKRNQLYLDATQRFPLPANAFDFVYSEHVIEHMTLPQAAVMLGECVRVLRPNGVLRIVTPDIAKLTSLIGTALTPLQCQYIEFSVKQYGIAGSPARGAHVLNHFVRTWGHTFIYDAETLVDEFRDAGFDGVVVCGFNQSAHAPLQNLAHIGRMPPGLLNYESLTVEGRKPAS